MNQVSTHVLDTGKGKPAWGVSVVLYEEIAHEWFEIAKGTTNKEGKLSLVVNEDEEPVSSIYKISFDTRQYFSSDEITTLFPRVEIIFEINTIGPYHIPLFISPYGYGTYRGC